MELVRCRMCGAAGRVKEYYEIDPEKVFSKETKDEASCL